mmetsp:Transcript_9597/g.14736  ORF Transcript_9597/g.14736 Transcript_9597/m.14736 type:complete len:85 (+) Transcript_9597:254-508(+)
MVVNMAADACGFVLPANGYIPQQMLEGCWLGGGAWGCLWFLLPACTLDPFLLSLLVMEFDMLYASSLAYKSLYVLSKNNQEYQK